jgi:hypothetical protein
VPSVFVPSQELAVFQDEVDVHLNAKIGSMWMRKGEQAIVETPGNNRKCQVPARWFGKRGRSW